MDTQAATQEMVLQRWEALEKRRLELRPTTALAKVPNNSNLEKMVKSGLAVPKVYPMAGSENVWVVEYAGIKVFYSAWGAEGKARRFAKSLTTSSPANDQNIQAAREFVESCENWRDYDSDENIEKFVNALLLVRPLTVSKIWTTFRSMVDVGDLKPRRL